MAGPNLDQFENFFRRADLDGDGRISGAEAVGFFQGSGLPKQVLAQIWMHADQSHCGFLGRQEFYNALKLVTVAQSKRELTQEIVKAALYGPAAAKIPPPQINLPPSNTPQMGGVAPPGSQNPGFRGPGLPNAGMGQSYFPSQQNQQIRPLQQPMPAATAARPPQGMAAQEFSRGAGMGGQNQGMPAATSMRPPQALPTGTTGSSLPNQNISSNWLGGRAGGTLTGPGGMAPSSQPAGLQSQPGFSMPSQPTTNDSKALVVSGNGFSTDQAFGGDAFSAITVPSSSRQESPKPSFSPGSAPTSPDFLPPSSGAQLPVKKSNSLDSLQSAFSMQPSGVPIQRTHSSSDVGQQGTHSSLNLGHQLSTPSSPSITSSGISAGVGNSAPDNSQVSWPKMKPSDVQKYTKVFMEVDTDRDGRITGEQARNLFLSWRLPRDVLKQVWDLSDQDSDSMLSLREFCFALYLMERSREGRPLPAMLPRNVMFDETLLSMTGQPNVAHGNAAWAPNPGFGPQPGMGAQPHTTTPFRPPSPPTAIPANNNMMPSQQKPRAPVLDDSFGNQRDNGGQNSMFSPDQDAAADANTAGGTEKVILDSREKVEFYRSKMQDLVLYKSRCDNRLNEITERAIADKREAEMLAKKYEEKYKQVAEIASKLTIEEAKFRETQERKTELHHAIINMEQGGSADGILQVRADRIQSDLEELLKALTQRCKKHGYELKTTAVIELPVGWQPGIQEGAAVWDEEWDKFEDEGFGHELSVDVRNSTSVQKGEAPQDGSLTPDSSSYADDKHGNIFSAGERALESESAYTHSDDESARSPRGSSAGRHAPESPSDQYSDGPFRKSAEADSETHRSFDESAWGAFDNDDTDSVWGFNPSKDSDSHSHGDFFGGSSDFGVNTIRTDSPGAESSFTKRSPFFEDSVPSTPLSKFGNSPPRFSEAGNHFDSFSRFDSFNTHDSGFGQPERLTRFDSINSSKDFGHGFSFDDNDPFGTSGPFKVSSSDGHSPKKNSDHWNAF